jgi:hypothetical protein
MKMLQLPLIITLMISDISFIKAVKAHVRNMLGIRGVAVGRCGGRSTWDGRVQRGEYLCSKVNLV